MRISGFKIRSLGPFANVSVDLDALPGVLIALTGGNGAGKSTAIELIPGALWRKTPTRGRLGDLATSRESSITVQVVNGQSWTIQQTVDAHTGDGDSGVLAAGAPVLERAKRREYDGWAKKHLPDYEVYLSSCFAAQQSVGFLGLERAERKSVLGRAIGVERLERMGASARKRHTAAATQLETVTARLRDEVERSGRVAVTRPALERARAAQETAAASAADAEAQLAALRAQADAARAAAAEIAAEQTRRVMLDGRLAELDSELAEVVRRQTANQKLRAGAARVEKAVQRDAEIAAALGQADLAIGEATAEIALVRVEASNHAELLRSLERRAAAAQQRLSTARARVRAHEEIEAIVARIPELTAARDRAATVLDALDGDLAQLGVERLTTAHDRIGTLRGTLTEISGGAAPADERAQHALDRDDYAVDRAEEVPKQQRELSKSRPALAHAFQSAQAALADALATEKRRQDVAHAAADCAASETEQRQCEEAAETHRTGQAAAEGRRQEAEGRRREAVTHREELLFERDKLAGLLAYVRPLQEAETRAAELAVQAQRIEADRARLTAERVALPPPRSAPPIPALQPAAEARETAQAEVTHASRRLALAEAAHAAAEAAEARLVEMDAVRAASAEATADWLHLAADLDALRALEIDAAGPELTTLVNDLLHTCHGPRWSVSIETTRPDSDGKRQLEDCEIHVLDGKRGERLEGWRLSPGERAIVSEACALALTMIGCRRSGLTGVTLFRDETGSGLDAESGRAYIAMLRRAAELLGASKVVFITHSAELAEAADARLRVVGGLIEVA